MLFQSSRVQFTSHRNCALCRKAGNMIIAAALRSKGERILNRTDMSTNYEYVVRFISSIYNSAYHSWQFHVHFMHELVSRINCTYSIFVLHYALLRWHLVLRLVFLFSIFFLFFCVGEVNAKIRIAIEWNVHAKLNSYHLVNCYRRRRIRFNWYVHCLCGTY